MLKYGLWASGALLVVVLGWFFIFNRQGAQADLAYTIQTETVETGDVARIVTASGAVRALTTVEVGSQISGQILELYADFNSEVSEDEIIARIDPQTFETRVASALADVESAKANIAVQTASIERAQATLQQAEKDFTRQERLYQEDAIALSLLEDTQRRLEVARADLAVSTAQLRTAKASLLQRESSLQSARVDLERTIIRSPITGVVIERNVDVGQTVAASFSAPVLFRIAQDLRDIRIDAEVVEADIGGIDAGDPATFRVDAYPDDEFTGVVEQVRLAAQELQNVVTYTVVIAANNGSGRLLPGMTANVEITADKREDVLRISESVMRFRPPADGPEVIETEGGRAGRGGGPGGPMAMMGGGGFAGGLLEDLDLPEARMEIISAEIGKVMQEMRQSMMQPGAAFDRNGMRMRMQARIDKILRDNLSDEEYAAVQAQQQERQRLRPVELYVENEDGTLAKSTVFIGLSDGQYLELIRGAEAGDTFVSRVLVDTSAR